MGAILKRFLDKHNIIKNTNFSIKYLFDKKYKLPYFDIFIHYNGVMYKYRIYISFQPVSSSKYVKNNAWLALQAFPYKDLKQVFVDEFYFVDRFYDGDGSSDVLYSFIMDNNKSDINLLEYEWFLNE